MRIKVIVAIFMGIMQASACWSQEVTGRLEGRLMNEAGKPVAYATVIVTSPNLQGARGGMADAQGYFQILGLPIGVYTVSISHIGYERLTYEQVAVKLGMTTHLPETRLAVRIHATPKTVVVARRPTIDAASNTLGVNLDARELQDLPLERDYRSVPALLPQVNQSFLGDELNFAGATGFENKYFIDGVEVTDPYYGATGTNLPYNFVQELEVRVGGYEAEYRSSLGAIVNVITPSGSNEFHARGFGFFANNSLSGEPRQATFEPPQGDYRQYDVGLNIVGPILRDRLWYAAAYNPTFQREGVDVPGIGFIEDKSATHTFTGKLTWQATQNTNLALTVIGDPTVRNGVGDTYAFFGTPIAFENPDPYLADIEVGGFNALLKGTHVLSTNAFLNASASVVTRRIKYEPATRVGRHAVTFIEGEVFQSGGIWSGGFPLRADDQSLQAVMEANASVVLGKHVLKAGLAYKDNRFEIDEFVHVIWLDSDGIYTDFRDSLAGTVHNRIPSIFTQDSWRVTERLRLNLGLRWDGQFLIGSDGKVAQRITDQYQPRVGFTLRPGSQRSGKVFGSFGRFYQELSAVLSSIEHNEEVITTFRFYDCDPRVQPCDPLAEERYGSAIQEEVDGLEGQHYDELTVGYERPLGESYTVGARGVYRALRQGIETLQVTETGEFAIGNPGKGRFSDWPRMKREYTALELTVRKFPGRHSSFIASYVLSRTYGNYSGLFNSDLRIGQPNIGTWDFLEALDNATGRLPNDRPHVLKLSGSYRFDLGLSVGGSLFWGSGTPLSEFAPATANYLNRFVSQRGSAGRTPWLWDSSLRFTYDPKWGPHRRWNQRFILDVLHIASQREPVDFEQNKFLENDDSGNPTTPNPYFLQPLRYQPPMAIRLGVEFEY